MTAPRTRRGASAPDARRRYLSAWVVIVVLLGLVWAGTGNTVPAPTTTSPVGDGSASPATPSPATPTTPPPSGTRPPSAAESVSTSTTAAQEQAAAFPRWGMSQGFEPIDLSDSRLASILDGIRRTGATTVRLDLPWQQIQARGPDSFDFANTLRVYDEAIAHGFTVLPVTSGIPSWAGGEAPTSSDAYYEFLLRAGQQLIPRGIRTIEVMNEANLTGMTPAQYTRLMLIPGSRGFRTAASRLGRTVTVVSSGLAPARTAGGDYSQLDFLRGIYAAGGRGYFDAVGVHPYTWPSDPAVAGSSNWLEKTTELRAVMIAHGDASKTMWATEFGFPTNSGSRGVSERTQAAFLVRGAAIWRSFGWAGPMIFYSFQDLGISATDPESHFGVVRSNGTAKPGFLALRKVITGR